MRSWPIFSDKLYLFDSSIQIQQQQQQLLIFKKRDLVMEFIPFLLKCDETSYFFKDEKKNTPSREMQISPSLV